MHGDYLYGRLPALALGSDLLLVDGATVVTEATEEQNTDVGSDKGMH